MSKALERNHTYLQKTIEMKLAIEGGYLVLAQRLAKIREEELYSPEYENFQGFLDEMNISEATASKMINIWLRLVVEYEIPKERLIEAGGWANLSEILPYAKTKEKALELIDKVTNLLPSDRRRVIRGLKTNIDLDKCNHDWYAIRVCRKCQDRQKIHEDE